MFINNLYEKIYSKKTQARSIHIYMQSVHVMESPIWQ
jgi:hypothetical protein